MNFTNLSMWFPWKMIFWIKLKIFKNDTKASHILFFSFTENCYDGWKEIEIQEPNYCKNSIFTHCSIGCSQSFIAHKSCMNWEHKAQKISKQTCKSTNNSRLFQCFIQVTISLSKSYNYLNFLLVISDLKIILIIQKSKIESAMNLE